MWLDARQSSLYIMHKRMKEAAIPMYIGGFFQLLVVPWVQLVAKQHCKASTAAKRQGINHACMAIAYRFPRGNCRPIPPFLELGKLTLPLAHVNVLSENDKVPIMKPNVWE